MVDVDDLAEVVGPVCAAIRVVHSRPAGWRLAARQHGCDRCEEIAPVKAGREVLRFPVDVPAVRRVGAALNQLKHAIAGADVPPAVSLEHNRRARPADSGINDGEKNGSHWKPGSIDRQQVCRRLGIAHGRISEEIDSL